MLSWIGKKSEVVLRYAMPFPFGSVLAVRRTTGMACLRNIRSTADADAISTVSGAFARAGRAPSDPTQTLGG